MMWLRGKYSNWITVCIIQVLVSDIVASCLKGNCTLDDGSETGQSSRILSRRKRFLVFPDGSSFQLGTVKKIYWVLQKGVMELKGVHLPTNTNNFHYGANSEISKKKSAAPYKLPLFCVQTAALIPIGDIFLYSNTAALAWNLPTDPEFFTMLKNHGHGDDKAQRRGDVKKHIYLIKDGKFLGKVPYKRKPIINPAFAKRSIDDPHIGKQKRPNMAAVKNWLHEKQSKRDFLKKENWDDLSVRFHRDTRASLFEKLEALFKALGQANGRHCVLRHLCRAAQASEQQGTFLEELLRIVYTLPKGDKFQKEKHIAYDEAHTIKHDCSLMYPECENLDILL